MRLTLCVSAIMLGLGAGAPARAAVTEDAFLMRSTGDLITLCGADRADPMYAQAQNFCHGFAVGTYQTLQGLQAGMRSPKKMFCPPAAPGSRNERIAAFVSWAGVHNELMALPPVDGIARYLVETYPCK